MQNSRAKLAPGSKCLLCVLTCHTPGCFSPNSCSASFEDWPLASWHTQRVYNDRALCFPLLSWKFELLNMNSK